MLRATLKGLLAHKLRLLLSAVAVVLGVAFVAGSLVFTSTLSRTFHDLFESVSADVTVTRATSFDQGLINSSTSSADFGVPASVLQTVKGVPGVAAADGDVQAEGVYVVDKDGKAIGGTGAPGIGIGWSGTPGLSATTITSGRPPAAGGEVAIDQTTAEKGGFAVGDTTKVLTPQGAQQEKI
ncbi:MAG TPA: ABC transporter permease, partial [Motilibacteraceae bacterium]|nr:ABC transporter permease [Motilibacteraceae bacterium]